MGKWKRIEMPFFDIYERTFKYEGDNLTIHFGVLNECGVKTGIYPDMGELDALSFTLYNEGIAHSFGINVDEKAQFYSVREGKQGHGKYSKLEIENLYAFFSECITEFDKINPDFAEKLRQGLDKYKEEALSILEQKQ